MISIICKDYFRYLAQSINRVKYLIIRLDEWKKKEGEAREEREKYVRDLYATSKSFSRRFFPLVRLWRFPVTRASDLKVTRAREYLLSTPRIPGRAIIRNLFSRRNLRGALSRLSADTLATLIYPPYRCACARTSPPESTIRE